MEADGPYGKGFAVTPKRAALTEIVLSYRL